MKAMRRIMIGVLFVCLAGLSGCSMAGDKNREVMEYLESRYGSREFEITRLGDGENVSWQVVPEAFPEAAFTVEKGTIDESWKWSYHDDYASCMLYGGAERLGLTWEKDERIEGEYNIFILYEDYASIDETAEKVEQLVTDCVESHAFDNLANRCLITVKPAGEPAPAFPGYEIRMQTKNASYTLDKVFGIMAPDLVPGQMKEDLRLCYIYNAYQYTLLRDNSMFSEDDLERYEEMCSGAMSRSDDGSITIYPWVNKVDSGLSFGGAYQVLLSEGLVTEEKEDSFIASGNGVTMEFFLRTDDLTSDRKPSVSFELLSGDISEVTEARLSNMRGASDTHSAVDLLLDKAVEFSTPEKLAAAEEEERLARLPLVQEAFAQAAAPGETASGSSMEVTITDMETYERLQGSNSSYMDSGKDTIWTRISVRITNTGSTEMYLFPHGWYRGSEGQLVGMIADEEANLYRASDIVGLGLDSIYGFNLPAGETAEGNIYMKLPREMAAKEDSLVFWIFRGEDSVSLLLPAED